MNCMCSCVVELWICSAVFAWMIDRRSRHIFLDPVPLPWKWNEISNCTARALQLSASLFLTQRQPQAVKSPHLTTVASCSNNNNIPSWTVALVGKGPDCTLCLCITVIHPNVNVFPLCTFSEFTSCRSQASADRIVIILGGSEASGSFSPPGRVPSLSPTGLTLNSSSCLKFLILHLFPHL